MLQNIFILEYFFAHLESSYETSGDYTMDDKSFNTSLEPANRILIKVLEQTNEKIYIVIKL